MKSDASSRLDGRVTALENAGGVKILSVTYTCDSDGKASLSSNIYNNLISVIPVENAVPGVYYTYTLCVDENDYKSIKMYYEYYEKLMRSPGVKIKVFYLST